MKSFNPVIEPLEIIHDFSDFIIMNANIPQNLVHDLAYNIDPETYDPVLTIIDYINDNINDFISQYSKYFSIQYIFNNQAFILQKNNQPSNDINDQILNTITQTINQYKNTLIEILAFQLYNLANSINVK